MGIKTYRLSVNGTIQFKDEDKELETKLLSSQYSSRDKGAIELALQELEETAQEINISLIRI